SADADLLNRYVINPAQVLQMPKPPLGLKLNIQAGADPTLRIPANLQVEEDGSVVVPVTLDNPHPEGSTGLTAATLALTYDPLQFTVSDGDIQLGSLIPAGSDWELDFNINADAGQIA